MPKRNVYNRSDTTHTKTAFYLPATPETLHRIKKVIRNKIKTDRPVEQTHFPEGPYAETAQVATPGGTKLYYQAHYGKLALFAEATTTRSLVNPTVIGHIKTLIKQVVDKNPVKGLVSDGALPKKIQTATLTRADILKVEAEKKLNKNRRKTDQAKVMADGSAGRAKISADYVKNKILSQREFTQYLDANKISHKLAAEMGEWITSFEPEWTHMIDHASLGEAAQIAANLIICSKQCNSHMMVVESLAKEWLFYSGKEQIKLTVEAKLVAAHFSYAVHYRIVTSDGFSTEFEFDPFTLRKPLAQAWSYVQISNEIQRERYLEKTGREPLQEDRLKRTRSAVTPAPSLAAQLGSSMANLFKQAAAATPGVAATVGSYIGAALSATPGMLYQAGSSAYEVSSTVASALSTVPDTTAKFKQSVQAWLMGRQVVPPVTPDLNLSPRP